MFLSDTNFCYRSRPIVALPISEPSNATTDGIPHTYFAPRARRDRARSEAVFRNASPITPSVAGLSTGAQSLSFSKEAEMIPSTSTNYRTLSAANTTNRILSNDLYQSVVNGSNNSSLSFLGGGRGGRDSTNNYASSNSSRLTYFHRPSNIVKSSLRYKYSSTFRNNY